MAHIDRQPTDEVFEDLKQAAISIWNDYDDTYGYASEKIGRINEICNYADNWCTFMGMFDANNQLKVADRLESPVTLEFLYDHKIEYGYYMPHRVQ